MIKNVAVLFMMLLVILSAGAVRADADTIQIDGEMKNMNTKTATFAMG